jgi:hypothetical protein
LVHQYKASRIMKSCLIAGAAITLLSLGATPSPAPAWPPTAPKEKTRVLILTDIENEPDDAQSLVRFLLYANMFDVEGIVATTSCWLRDKIADWRVHEIVDAYGKVRDQLERHEPGYPTHAALKAGIKRGKPVFGMQGVGEGQDSEGSDWIIQTVDRDDPRPLWIPIWGGANCLAQALWKVKATRSEEELRRFVEKIRVYTISDQDDSGPWMRATFPDLFYIVSPGYHENQGNAYFYATWSGISGERHYKFPSGADTFIVSNAWVDLHIREGRGPLGAEYPHTAYIMEGDTPSFLYLIDNGLNVPERPDHGGWGGRYELYTPPYRKYHYYPETRPIWTDAEDMVHAPDGKIHISNKASIWRWREAYQNDFAARMAWCVRSYEEANHPPAVALNHPNAIEAKQGESVVLDGSPTSDPDDDALRFRWWHYREPGSFKGVVSIENADQPIASLIAPKVNRPETLHLILEVSDNGTPALWRYQRVILTVNP